MTDIIGVMCTPLGRFPSDRWSGEVKGILRQSHESFCTMILDSLFLVLRAPGRLSASVSPSLSARFGLGSRMRAILSKRQNITSVYVFVCVCTRKMEKNRDTEWLWDRTTTTEKRHVKASYGYPTMYINIV